MSSKRGKYDDLPYTVQTFDKRGLGSFRIHTIYVLKNAVISPVLAPRHTGRYG